MKRYLAALGVVSVILVFFVPYQDDFDVFYAAGQAILHGQNPYVNSGFFNPIHVAWLMTPLALLPFEVAWRLYAGLAFFSVGWAILRLFPVRVAWVAALAPFGLLVALTGNLDGWVLLGASWGSPWGVFLLLMKPQMGLFAALLLWWKHRRNLALTVAIEVVAIVSVWGGMIHGGLNVATSVDLWPYGAVVGLPLLALAVKRRDPVLALSASPFLSPYVTILNWSAALPLFRQSRALTGLVVAASWALFLFWRFR